MVKCTFCGRAIKEGTGKMFVYASGKIDHYCSNKCEKNLHKLRRKPLVIKWTETYQKEHKKGTHVKAADKKVEVEKKPKVAEE